mgnify:FL=1
MGCSSSVFTISVGGDGSGVNACDTFVNEKTLCPAYLCLLYQPISSSVHRLQRRPTEMKFPSKIVKTRLVQLSLLRNVIGGLDPWVGLLGACLSWLAGLRLRESVCCLHVRAHTLDADILETA